MLRMTTAAADALTATRTDAGAPDTYGVRFTATAAQEGQGTRIGFEFVPSPQPNDGETEESGLKAYTSPEVAAIVGDAVVDVEQAGDGARLVMRRDVGDGSN